MNDWHDAELRFERALQWVRRRNWPQALREMQIATSINPFNGDWFFNLGLILDELGRHEEALEAYRQSDQIEPDNLQVLNCLGVDLIRTGRFRQSLRVFDRMTDLDSACESAYCHRILARAELGEHEQAEEAFYLARQHKEHCPRCYDHMGRSLASRRLFHRAAYCFQKCLDLDGNWPDARRRLGESLWNQGELEQARREFLADLRQNPGRTQTLLDLGDLLMEMGRIDEAGEKFRRCIETDPAMAAAYWRYGRWLRINRRHDQAKSTLEQSLRLDPTLCGAHLELARLALACGDRETACIHLRSESLRRSEDAQILLGAANLWMDCGHDRTAIICLGRLIDKQPKNAQAWLNLGVAELRCGFYTEGLYCCHKALQLGSDTRAATLAVYNLALAYERLGKYTLALAWARRARRMAPGDMTLARLELRLGVLRWFGGIASGSRKIFRRFF